MSLRSKRTDPSCLAIPIGALWTALLVAGCVTITADYPAPGQPIQARAGQALVFGHVKVIGASGEVFFPVERGLATPASPGLVERLVPNLSLYRLGSWAEGARSPSLKFEGDGSLSVWAPTGYYALALWHPRRGGKYQMENVALIRVPGDAVAAYAGNLTITIAMEPTATLLESQPYTVAGVRVTSNLAADKNSLEARYGPLSAPPAESLWCPPSGAEGRAEEFDHAVAIAELNAGCTDFVTVPLPTAPRR
jgi:hypothetical protein